MLAKNRGLKFVGSMLSWALILMVALWLGGWARGLMMTPASQALPQTHLAPLDGGVPRLPQHHKPQLLYLFAPWCTICKLTFDHLGEWQQQGRAVQAIALDYQTVAEVREFVDGFAPQPQPVLLADRAWSDHLGVVAFPTYLIVDGDGTVIAKRVGYLPQWALSLYLSWYQI